MNPEDIKLFTKLHSDVDYSIMYSDLEKMFMKKKLKKKDPPKKEALSAFDIFKNFHDSYTEKISEHAAKYVEGYKEISQYLSDKTKTFLQIRQFLSNYSSQYLTDVNTFSQADENIQPVEAVFESVMQECPNIEFVDREPDHGMESLKGLPTISFNIPVSIKRVSLEENDAWEFKPETKPISIIFNNAGVAKYIDTNLIHPYIPRNQTLIGVPAAMLKRKVTKSYILDTFKDTISYFNTYDNNELAQPIEHFIGKKCAVCSVRDNNVNVSCRESGVVMHESCGKKFNSQFYNPKYIKTCSVCEQENLFWIIKSGNVICEKCNNE